MTDAQAEPGGVESVRRLRPDDLEPAIAIDKAITGQSRRGYFERRLAAAKREPSTHIQLAVDGADGLAGFILARVLSGEYGAADDAVVLEVIDVDPARRRHGAGQMLLTALEAEMQQRGLRRLQTEVDWRAHDLLRLLDRDGFSLARRTVLRCAVGPSPDF